MLDPFDVYISGNDRNQSKEKKEFSTPENNFRKH